MRFPLLTRPLVAATAALLLLAAGAPCAAQAGDVTRVHDPCIIAAAGRYYVFSTGRGVQVRTSDDLFNWRLLGPALEPAVPGWAQQVATNARGEWAPDIHFIPPPPGGNGAGEFRLYYAISTFGRRRSAIGLATSPTLDPRDKNYAWRDRGKVIETFDTDDYNAIDPNLVIDRRGDHWLVFGSYWSGIKARKLDAATGLASGDDTKLYALAARGGDHSLEAPFVFRHGDYHYLIASYDHCCRGAASTYNLRVGRSRDVTGPYVDSIGRDMLAGGGTLLLASYGNTRGPGHCGVVQTPDLGDSLVHHFYDAASSGRPAMQIRPIYWSADGWPLVGEPLAAPPTRATTQPAAAGKFDPTGRWLLQIDVAELSEVQLLASGRVLLAAPTRGGVAEEMPGASWRMNGATLELTAPGETVVNRSRTAHCVVAADGRSFVGRDGCGRLFRAIRPPG